MEENCTGFKGHIKNLILWNSKIFLGFGCLFDIVEQELQINPMLVFKNTSIIETDSAQHLSNKCKN